MNNLTPRPLLYLIVGLFIFAASIIIASAPGLEPTKIPSNKSIFGDCIVQDITWKYDDEGYRESDSYGVEEYSTEMNCESENRQVTVDVIHFEPDWIGFRIELGRFYLWRRKTDDTTLLDLSGWDLGDEEGKFVSPGGITNVIISSKESYKPKDFLDDLTEDEKFKLEFEGNDQKIYIYTLKFDGAKKAVKEFRKRVNSLQETSNEN